MATRQQIELACLEALDADRTFIDVSIPGDPSAKRHRLFGHHCGPRGTTIGWNGNDVIVRYDASIVLKYIDHTDKELDYESIVIVATTPPADGELDS